MHRPGPRRVVGSLLLIAAAFSACADDGSPPRNTTTTLATGNEGEDELEISSAACGKVIAEPLDPNSGSHLLPGAAEPPYLTDPPTSGAHRTGDYPTGVLADAIERPVQAAMLEAGQVLIQHGDLDEPEFDRLAALATAGVSVAPNPSLPGKVVATATQVKLICTSLDVPALRKFIAAYLAPEESH